MNDEEILKIVLTNLINMLTERGVLKSENLEKNVKNIINDITVEKVFKVKSETSNNIYNIMIVNGKISTVNKINGFDSFINFSSSLVSNFSGYLISILFFSAYS